MDTEGMTPHPIFAALRTVSTELNKSFNRRHQPPSVGWDLAFADLEESDDREQAFAFSLGFADATEYHAETDWADRNGLMVDWYEQTDLRP